MTREDTTAPTRDQPLLPSAETTRQNCASHVSRKLGFRCNHDKSSHRRKAKKKMATKGQEVLIWKVKKIEINSPHEVANESSKRVERSARVEDNK